MENEEKMNGGKTKAVLNKNLPSSKLFWWVSYASICQKHRKLIYVTLSGGCRRMMLKSDSLLNRN